MNLLIIRHGIAEDRDVFAQSGKPDELRPLTDEGRIKMTHNAHGLQAIAPEIDVLATSPLVRAHQTAEIVAAAYGIEIRATTEALRPEASFDEFIDWIDDRTEQHVVAVVGHEPHLSTLATWLVSGVHESRLELKKGGACLISFASKPQKGNGTLEWLLRPRELNLLRKAER